jgi:hypothetical protein
VSVGSPGTEVDPVLARGSVVVVDVDCPTVVVLVGAAVVVVVGAVVVVVVGSGATVTIQSTCALSVLVGSLVIVIC